MFKLIIVKDNFEDYYDDLFTFCKKAEEETKIEKTKLNMKGENWEDYNTSLLHRVYKKRKYDNNNGMLTLLYDDKNIIASSGIEKYTNEVAIIAKRYYVLKSYRSHIPILSTYMLPEQISWSKEHKINVCLITVNEYQKNTVLKIIERAKNNMALVLGQITYPEENIFSKMEIFPEKIKICGESQYVVYYLNKECDIKGELRLCLLKKKLLILLKIN